LGGGGLPAGRSAAGRGRDHRPLGGRRAHLSLRGHGPAGGHDRKHYGDVPLLRHRLRGDPGPTFRRGIDGAANPGDGSRYHRDGERPSLTRDMTPLRAAGYEANLRLARHKLAILTWGNASAYDPASGLMAIKPSGVDYDVLAPRDMVVIDVETGLALEGTTL